MTDMRVEALFIPVLDVERAKRFYDSVGWRLDEDVAPSVGVRIIQFTPPRSGCSVNFGRGLTAAEPGRGANPGGIFHSVPQTKDGRQAGAHPEVRATRRSSSSATRTAPSGSSRRSPPARPGASDAAAVGRGPRRLSSERL